MRKTITRDDGSTYELEIPDHLIKEFHRASEQMRRFLVKWKAAVPEGFLYLAVDNPTLMAGPSHIGHSAGACHENEVATGRAWIADGGDW